MTEPSDPSSEPEDQVPHRLERKLEEARKELLETSTRSRLLHTPLGSPRAKIVEVQAELADQVFRILVREGKSMSFLAAPDTAEENEQGFIALRQPEDDDVGESGLARRHTDTRLQTALSSTKLQARLRGIAYDAQTFENERGVNILYLALGFLKWYEPTDTERPRYAPLILVPVTLTRASANERFKAAYSGEELSTNLSLQQRLKEEGVELPDLPHADDLSPTAYAADVGRAIAGMPNWELLPDSITLGLFSFAKLMMYRDLEPDRWPLKRGLREHSLIQGLLGDGFREEGEPLLPDDVPLDTLIDIGSAGHVVDADSSQMLAIEDVRRGHDLVIQGPPGTGKSQTITNLIASAVREGKRVLFVAEKMAALNVVRSNLDRVQLGQLCLELHSHKAQKKRVLEDLEQTYELAGAAHEVGQQSLADELRAARDALNSHVRRIHTPLEPSGTTPFEVFGKLARLAVRGVASPDFQLPASRGWTRRDTDDRARRLERLADQVLLMGLPLEHPWRGAGLDVVLPQDAERIAGRARLLHDAIASLAEQGGALAARAGASCTTLAEAQQLILLGEVVGRAPMLDAAALAHPAWTDARGQISELVQRGLAYASARARLKGALVPQAWEEDLTGIRREFTTHGDSWLRWFRGGYRAAVARFRALHIGPPPKLVARRLEILGTLLAGRRARQDVRVQDALGRSAFGKMWMADASDWAGLEAIEIWERGTHSAGLAPGWQSRLEALGDLPGFSKEVAAFARNVEAQVLALRALFDDMAFDVTQGFGVAGLDSIPLPALADRLGTLAATPERLQQWSTWRIWSREARNAGVAEVVDRLADGRIDATSAADVFRYACYEVLARQVFSEHPELAAFDGRSHERVLADFQRLDRERLALARREVGAQHIGLMPKGGHELGEVGILAREWRKQRRHLPLRQLIKAAGRAMQLMKPVWMMSPMSLAQFVEPGAVEFDLVVMDEASQVRPVEALGAIARGRQVVVVGDDKQLPPTSFFDRVAAEDAEPVEAEDFQVADVESILGLCTAQGIPDRMLRWHYRSQHESLIAVSNLEFYRRLFIVPSAESEDLGLRLRRVNGIYDRGRSATNHVEAQEVARAVIEHARRHLRSARFPNGMSLGVGTFSVPQRDAILDELELLWRQHPELVAFFDPNAPEPFFVKNLESIQGDERDVVFVSVGYGRDADGYMTMYFGPLSHQGGERRLNVLISRARRRCEVFSSITADDIDLGRTQSVGVRVLKTFLRYAETGQLDRSQVGQRAIDSDFEAEVGVALAGLGYQVEHQVGVAGFFVDLAIKDSECTGRYLVGIECDGATYHSSRSARDRDRLREQVLRDRGWHIHRVWSADWFRRRHEELQRAVVAIEAARSTGRPTPPVANEPEPVREPPLRPDPDSSHTAASSRTAAAALGRPYVEATFSEQITFEPHEVPVLRRVDILVRIVTIEGPIHEEEIARRYAWVCGKERTGNRIQEAVRQGLGRAVRENKLHADGAFYTLEPLAECPPRDRSATRSSSLRRPEMLPSVEIRTGLRQIVADHVGVEPQGAIVEVARMFGFQRTGPDLQQAIEDHLRAMLGESVFVLRNNRLYTV